MQSRNVVLMKLFVGQEETHRCRGWTMDVDVTAGGERRGKNELREQN